jgi:hypothetical protein
MKEQELLQLKERITNAKAKVNELKGRHNYLMQELAQQWGCKTVAEAEAKVNNMNAEIVKLDAQINVGLIKLTEEITNETT